MAGLAHAQQGAQSGGHDDGQSTLDFCVRCTVPDATHVCSVIVDGGIVSVGEWRAFCGAQLAFDGGHHQCKATQGIETCDASRQFTYRNTTDQGIVSVESVPGEPGPRPGGMFEGAVDYVRRTGEDVSETLGEGATAVGETVMEGAQVVGDTAADVGRGLMRGAQEVGKGVAKGVGCVFTLGKTC